MNGTGEQITIFDLDTPHGKMSPVPSVRGSPKARTSASYSKNLQELQTTEYQYLDLRAGYGNLLGAFWESNSLLLGEYIVN